MESKQFVELVEGITKAALAIHDQWGCTSDQYNRYVQTYTTTLKVRVGCGVFSIRGNEIESDSGWGFSKQVQDINTLLEIERELGAMALYFASEEWLNKLDGSISRLKAITKALSH